MQPYLKEESTLQGGKYRIDKVLGQGGFGITYLAVHTLLDKQVAIKEFFPKTYCDRDESTSRVILSSRSNEEWVGKFKEKFKKEARNISRLEHSGIIKIHDIFEENETAYYVMDYISGGSLDDAICRRKGLDEAESLAMVMQIGSALSFMHSHRMLHLDLKPANVMLRVNGDAVLIDFGLSKLYDEGGNPETSISVGRGTLGYAPTEQADYRDGQGFPVTMDVYALGATLFKLLTGTPPPAPSVILNNGFPEKELITRGVGAATRAIIIRAMSPRQADRYQSVEEMLAAVGNITESVGSVSTGKPDEITVIDIDAPVLPRERKKTPESHVSVGSALGPHVAVDLGLSVKWATCNVGASLPSDYGNNYAWGEVSIKSEYMWDNSKTYKKNYGNIGCDSSTDAACAYWGGSWRLPSKSEYEELVNNCIWTWMTMNGKNGYKVTGKNGNSIFLPAAGWHEGPSLYGAGFYGLYWSFMPDESGTGCAYGLYFDNDNHYVGCYYRYRGFSVRPVTE